MGFKPYALCPRGRALFIAQLRAGCGLPKSSEGARRASKCKNNKCSCTMLSEEKRHTTAMLALFALETFSTLLARSDRFLVGCVFSYYIGLRFLS